MKCKNCDNKVDGQFCSQCGQNSKIDKLNLPNFLTEISDNVFQLNRGLLYTIKELFTRPGHAIRGFIQGKRKNYFKPIAYALTLSTLYFIFSKIISKKTIIGDTISGFIDASTGDVEKFSILTSSLEWLASNVAYAALILIPIYSFASYMSFLGKGYNYLEHIVLNSYIVGQQAIIYSIFLLPSIFISNDYYIQILMIIISISYVVWTFKTFFHEQRLIATTLRLVLVYLLIFIFIIGIFTAVSLGEMVIKKY